MKLRPHQIAGIEMLRASLRSGKKRPILAAPCSYGKTLTAAYIIKSALSKGKRVIFICDRIKLVEQSVGSFSAQGIEFGVMQGDHWMTDYSKPLQIASMQTLSSKIRKHGSRVFDFDLCIVDEAHVVYKTLADIMEKLDAVPFIGLSATPFSKGLGKYYDDLLVPATSRDLLADGYLCPVDYYGGRKVALEGVKTRAIPTGGRDYDEKSLAEAVEKDTTLVGDIITNWQKHASGRQTVAFAPSINHSKELVRQFQAAGISAEHIDGYMDVEEREDILKAHDRGEFLILSCSRLLNTGWDSPTTSCLIDCFPTKSYIVYVQRIGRVMRIAEGKENAIVLDHAGNVSRFGFAEDVVPVELDDGEKDYNEKQQIKEKEEKEVKTHECPQCFRHFTGLRCSCGYEIPIKVQIESDAEELVKLAKAENKMLTRDEKRKFYSELLGYANAKFYKASWADHKYRERFGVWPNGIDKNSVKADVPTQETKNWITSRNIAWANRKGK